MKKLTALQKAMLVDFYEHGDLDMLAKDLRTTRAQLHSWAKVLGFRVRSHHEWSEEDDAYLIANYANTSNKDLAAHLGCSVAGINARNDKLGLRKSREYLQENGRKVCQTLGSLSSRYRKGQAPANKGKKMSPEVYEKAKGTMFKKGARSGKAAQNYMPVGTTRLICGYVYRKVAEVPNVAYTVNWKLEHYLVWEKANGPVPAKHCLRFKDGNKQNTALENLVLITRKENRYRNSIHTLPPELKSTVYALGQLTKTIKRHVRQQHGEPAVAPLRDDRETEERNDERGDGASRERRREDAPGECQSGDRVHEVDRREQELIGAPEPGRRPRREAAATGTR